MLMFPSILMLVCAWSLGTILKNDLETGRYVACMVCSVITIEFFPVLCFIFAALIAWMIGSAWATIGLMFPIVIDMLQSLLNLGTNVPLESVELIIPLIGATLSGAVLGVHLSVLSDNPIMSAASTGANHLEHIKTMAWYVIPIGLVAAVGFTFIGVLGDNMGHTLSLTIGLIGGSILTIAVLELCQYLFSKGKSSN
jgi:Na+/H+ antiporter NhaC